MYKNSKFKALSPERQEQVKARMYDRYLQPVMKNNGMIPPLKENWLKGTGDTQNFGGSDEQKKERLDVAGVIGAEQLAKATLFGSKLLHTTALFEDHKPFLELFAPILKREGDALEWASSRTLSKVNDWKADHYREIQEHNVASLAGESMGQLPLYMALGGLWSGAGISTKTLAKTPWGRFVAGKLIAAADGYMSTKVLGGSDTKALAEGARYATGEAILQGGGKVLLATGSATKAYLSKLLALGGRKLVQETFAKAVAAPGTQPIADPLIAKISIANKKILDSLAQETLKKDFDSLSKEEQAKVTTELGKVVDKAEKEVVIHGQDVIRANVQLDLAKTPALKAQVNSQNVTKQIVDKAKVETGMIDPVKLVENLNKPTRQEVERWKQNIQGNFGIDRRLLDDVPPLKPGELQGKKLLSEAMGTKPDKSRERKLVAAAHLLSEPGTPTVPVTTAQRAAQLREGPRPNLTFEQQLGRASFNQVHPPAQKMINERVVPGAANPKSLEFAINAANKYAPKIMMRLEGVKNKLLFAYSISNEKDKKILLQHLKDEFRDEAGKQESKAQIDDRIKVLYQHIQEMGLAGHIPPEDERGVFRSTRTAGDPTKWQQQLKDEVAAIDGKLKNYPSARAALKAINKMIGEAQ